MIRELAAERKLLLQEVLASTFLDEVSAFAALCRVYPNDRLRIHGKEKRATGSRAGQYFKWLVNCKYSGKRKSCLDCPFHAYIYWATDSEVCRITSVLDRHNHSGTEVEVPDEVVENPNVHVESVPTSMYEKDAGRRYVMTNAKRSLNTILMSEEAANVPYTVLQDILTRHLSDIVIELRSFRAASSTVSTIHEQSSSVENVFSNEFIVDGMMEESITATTSTTQSTSSSMPMTSLHDQSSSTSTLNPFFNFVVPGKSLKRPFSNDQ